MLISTPYSASNMVAAVPGWDSMPAPTTEIFATLVSTLTEEFFKYYDGIFSETFLYYEEWATSILLHKAGLKTKVAACSPIIHLGGASTPEDIRRETPRSRKIRNESGRKVMKLMFIPRRFLERKD